jgi:ubiquinone/menaquinone biosynthesis C-methylase UbiE
MDDPSSPTSRPRPALERSRRKWEFWSGREALWGVYERDTRQHRARAVDSLGLDAGDAVLDVGCGPGANFGLLREAVGAEGSVLGVDFSPGMVGRANERIDDHGWTNVETLRADVTRRSLGSGRFDGALATTAVSTTRDVRATVGTVFEALKPDTRFAVYDIRLVPAGPGRLLNPLVRRFYRAFGNWNADEDVLARLEETFDAVEVLETFALGTNYVAVATRTNSGGTR